MYDRSQFGPNEPATIMCLAGHICLAGRGTEPDRAGPGRAVRRRNVAVAVSRAMTVAESTRLVASVHVRTTSIHHATSRPVLISVKFMDRE